MLDRLAFTAMAAARVAQEQLSLTTHNLANAGTSGFREQFAAFRSIPVRGEGAGTRATVVDSTPGFSSAGGRVEQTGNPYDLAIEGDGWFSVRRADGSVGYTRDGRFSVDKSGNLRTATGAMVMGERGPIVMPQGTIPEVGGDGEVFARRHGEPVGTSVGRLRIVRADPGLLDRGADGLFVSVRNLPLAGDGVRVRQGAIESSNVSVSSAMVDMIAQTRLFDLSVQIIKTADQNARAASALVSGGRS